ncbi:MAG: cell wall hydrolase [Nanoarchaeota archaeon]|nr:cell wall hydrolase [Nanoarchaeota archaeon]
MMNRRQFLRAGGTWVAGNLVFPLGEVWASPRKTFYEDSEQVLLARMIFGEGRGVSYSEKVAIGLTPLNRVSDNKRYTGRNIKEAILLPLQYSCFNQNDKNFEIIKEPFIYEPKKWVECLDISRKILDGMYNQYNFGQTHFHKKGVNPLPDWASNMKERLDSTGFAHQFYVEG